VRKLMKDDTMLCFRVLRKNSEAMDTMRKIARKAKTTAESRKTRPRRM
jgi:hypothetical protein